MHQITKTLQFVWSWDSGILEQIDKTIIIGIILIKDKKAC